MRTVILALAVAAIGTCAWLAMQWLLPSTPSGSPSAPLSIAEPAAIRLSSGTPHEVEDGTIVRSQTAWATLRILDEESQEVITSATVVLSTPMGTEDAGIELQQQRDDLLVMSRPPDDQALWLCAAGYALKNVTAPLLRGGEQILQLRRAMKYELVTKDGTGAEVDDVEVGMYRGVIGRGPTDDLLTEEGQSVWPTARTRGKSTFWLPAGAFRPILTDDSLLPVAGGELVLSDGSGAASGELELAGVLVAALRFLGESPNTMRVRDLSSGAKILTQDKVQPLADRLAHRLGSHLMFFAQTPRLGDRHAACSGLLEFAPAGGAPQATPIDFHPIASVRIQELSSAPATTSGRLRVRILDREGYDVVGVRVPIHAAGTAKSPAPVAFVHSGDDVALAAGSYVLEPALQGAGERIAHPASVTAGQNCEAVIQLPNPLTKVSVSVRFDDDSTPGYAVLTAVTSAGTAVHRSRRPSDIPLWLPPGKGRLEVVVSDDSKASLEIDVTRDSAAPPIVVRVPKPR